MLAKILTAVFMPASMFSSLDGHVDPLRASTYPVVLACSFALLLAARLAENVVQWTIVVVPVGAVLVFFALRGLVGPLRTPRFHDGPALNLAVQLGTASAVVALAFAATGVDPASTLDGVIGRSVRSEHFWFYWSTCAMCITHVLLMVSRMVGEGSLAAGRTRSRVVECSLVGATFLGAAVYLGSVIHPLLSARGLARFDLRAMLELPDARPMAVTLLLFQGLWLLFGIAWCLHWRLPEARS